MWMISFITQYFVVLLLISYLLTLFFGVFVSRHVPRTLLISLTLITALSTLAALFVFTVNPEVSGYAYVEIAAYLIVFLIITVPITTVGWLVRPKRVHQTNTTQIVGPERRERVSHQTWCGEG